MATSSVSKNNITTLITYLIVIILSLEAQTKHACACFKSIVSLGDSIADTGNLLRLSPPSEELPHYAVPPYGETFFHRPTGRFSDGRLIIDFIAQDLGLPFVQPFFGGKILSMRGGVNFAVAGATALRDPFFSEAAVEIPVANVSLVAQMSWFKDAFLPTFCQKPADCKKILESSLILMGEIGGNDYNYAFSDGKSLDVLQSLVPQVVKAISLTINELISLGAVTLMVPGNFPIGCLPSYLTDFKSYNKEDYDPETGCLSWLNRFSQYHNELLQLELNLIQEQNPNINIIYADYYNVAMQLYRFPQKYGFTKDVVLKACCGAGGPYNVNTSRLCGCSGTAACEDPFSYISWDGWHFTEAAYRLMAMDLIRGSFTIPQFYSVCPVSSKNAARLSDH